MSERQAKKIRKQEPAVEQKQPKNKGNALFNAIAVIVIVAVAALAGYAIWSSIEPADTTTTFAEALTNQGTDFDTAVAEWGLDATAFTPDMPSEEASMLFTLENMAKMDGKEVADYVKELGLPEDVATNVPSKDMPISVMMKVSGLESTVEDLREFGLSEDITEDTLWGEAQEEVINAVYASLMVQQQEAAEAETPAEGEE